MIDKYILYISHNSLPPEAEKFFSTKLRESSGNIPIITVQVKDRNQFGDINIISKVANIRSQTLQGVDKIETMSKNPYIFIAEHDVIYPPDYFTINDLKPNIIYKNTNWYFCTNRGFLKGESWIHSNTIAHSIIWKYCFTKEDNRIRFKDKSSKLYKHIVFSNPTPVIDVRWGGNITGPRGIDKSDDKFMLQRTF
jgi:hypothetical protein